MTTAPRGSVIETGAMADCLEAAFKQTIEAHFDENQNFSQMLQNMFASYMPVPPQVWSQFLQAQKTSIGFLQKFQPAAELLKQAGDPDLASMFSDAISVMELTIQNIEARLSGPGYGMQSNIAPAGRSPIPGGFASSGGPPMDAEAQRKAHEMAMKNMNAQRESWARINQLNNQTSETILGMQRDTMRRRGESADRAHKAFLDSI